MIRTSAIRITVNLGSFESWSFSDRLSKQLRFCGDSSFRLFQSGSAPLSDFQSLPSASLCKSLCKLHSHFHRIFFTSYSSQVTYKKFYKKTENRVLHTFGLRVQSRRVRPAQQLLFPDPSPLVERLGRDFFRQLPQDPGVYLMRDESETVLYVGKAKNLRKRLGSYRVANPDRMPRRHLRLVRSVVRIELQPCATETEALARESELLRRLRPRFNRAGTWQAPPRWFGWRIKCDEVHLATLKEPGPDWRCFGPMGIRAEALRAILARLLWLALNPESGFTSLPAGWFHGDLEQEAALKCAENLQAVAGAIEAVLSTGSAALADNLAARFSPESRRFDQLCLENDLASLAGLCPLPQVAPR